MNHRGCLAWRLLSWWAVRPIIYCSCGWALFQWAGLWMETSIYKLPRFFRWNKTEVFDLSLPERGLWYASVPNVWSNYKRIWSFWVLMAYTFAYCNGLFFMAPICRRGWLVVSQKVNCQYCSSASFFDLSLSLLSGLFEKFGGRGVSMRIF